MVRTEPLLDGEIVRFLFADLFELSRDEIKFKNAL